MKELNFLPRSFVEARRRRRILRMQILVMAAILAALVAWFTAGHMALGRVEAEIRGARDVEDVLGRQLQAMQQLQRRQGELLRRQEFQCRLGNWVPRSNVVVLVTRVLPERVGLVELRMLPAKPSQERLRELGIEDRSRGPRSRARRRKTAEMEEQEVQTELVITGIAPSDSHCTRVVARMGAHSAFKNVRLVYQRHRLMGERILREFQIRCLLVEKQREDAGG
jgi:hypothetical protein